LSQRQEAESVARRLIEPLARNDRAEQAQLLPTVVAWVTNNCVWDRTARQLGAHLHTLRNRIDAAHQMSIRIRRSSRPTMGYRESRPVHCRRRTMKRRSPMHRPVRGNTAPPPRPGLTAPGEGPTHGKRIPCGRRRFSKLAVPGTGHGPIRSSILYYSQIA
jgi:hypothetical protein